MGAFLQSNGERSAADMSHLQYDEHRTFDAIWIRLEKRRLGKTSKRAQDIAVSVKHMNSFELEPKHSTSQIPGKCIKCLAEQELNNCLLEPLRGNAVPIQEYL
ncbi:hypothetical protein ACFLW7_00285 [Chloroflexota bacterium]